MDADLAAACDVPGKHDFRSRRYPAAEPAHVDCTQEILNTHDHDR